MLAAEPWFTNESLLLWKAFYDVEPRAQKCTKIYKNNRTKWKQAANCKQANRNCQEDSERSKAIPMQISLIPAATVGIGFCAISMNSLVISIVCRLTHDLEWLARCGDFNRMHWMLESVPPIPSLYMFGVSLDALVASHGSLNFLGTPFGCYTKAKACENNFHRAADWQLGEPM